MKLLTWLVTDVIVGKAGTPKGATSKQVFSQSMVKTKHSDTCKFVHVFFPRNEMSD